MLLIAVLAATQRIDLLVSSLSLRSMSGTISFCIERCLSGTRQLTLTATRATMNPTKSFIYAFRSLAKLPYSQPDAVTWYIHNEMHQLPELTSACRSQLRQSQSAKVLAWCRERSVINHHVISLEERLWAITRDFCNEERKRDANNDHQACRFAQTFGVGMGMIVAMLVRGAMLMVMWRHCWFSISEYFFGENKSK